MKKYFLTLAAVLSCTVTSTVFTACSVDDNPVPEVVVTDDKPFPYDTEMDQSVRPGDDFYRHALGQWLNSSNPSPSIFQQIQNEYKVGLEQMLSTSNDPVVALLRRQAQQAMTDDSRSVALLSERLQMLEQVETAEQLHAAFATLHEWGYSPLFQLVPMPYVGKQMVNLVVTGGMTNEMKNAMARKNQEKVDSLVEVTCQKLSLMGFSDERIADIMESAKDVERMEMEAYNSRFDMLRHPLQLRARRAPEDEGETSMEDIAISIVFALMGLEDGAASDGTVLFTHENLTTLMMCLAFAADEPDNILALRDYMIYNVMAQDADCVPHLTGQSSLSAVMRNAFSLNKYYKYRLMVEYYGYENIYKQQCEDIMERMRQLFLQRIDGLDWMGEATKAEARHKAETMKFYIGYPEQWNDAFTPEADGDCLLASVTQLRQHHVENVKKLRGANMDDVQWDAWASYASFTTDNAFYSALANSLVILPSWITKPRFDNDLSEATLYATATTFGHEFCHGFDSNGSEYDADGNPRDWWQPADRAAFQAKQQIMVELYNQLEDYPGQPADGQKTLGENMADYGGVELALECYKQRLTEQGFKGAQFDEQIKKFFLSYAQIWKNESELDLEELKFYHENDTHSLCHNRVNGMMRLQDEWYHLYDVKPTDKLYLAPEDRVKIW